MDEEPGVLLEHVSGIVVKDLAGRRQRQAPGRSIEQLEPSQFLELGDRLAQGRLPQMQGLGSARHRAQLDDGDERAQMARVEVIHLNRMVS